MLAILSALSYQHRLHDFAEVTSPLTAKRYILRSKNAAAQLPVVNTMTKYQHNENPNWFVRILRKLYNPLGFSKGYNAALWFVFAGALFGFGLARANYLNVNGIFKTASGPGEWFYYSIPFYKGALTAHLACVVPACILAIFQFTPVIRYKAIMVHRVNGYILILLITGANASALMIARHAFGGTLATQAYVGTLAILTTGSLVLSYINIKRLQIEQHRAWMLRCWAWLGTILTTRIILPISAIIIGQLGDYFMAVKCQQIAFSAGEEAAAGFAGCAADPNGWAVVEGSLYNPEGLANVIAAFQLTFGMAAWVALVLHTFGVELYLHLTPAEAERLRTVSYERQLERGLTPPGSAGLTADKLGDAEPWCPPILRKKIAEERGSSADLSRVISPAHVRE